jgi:hypothetical protein
MVNEFNEKEAEEVFRMMRRLSIGCMYSEP